MKLPQASNVGRSREGIGAGSRIWHFGVTWRHWPRAIDSPYAISY